MRVLIVDERPSVQAALATSLSEARLGDVLTASEPAGALKLLAEWRPHAVILEVKRRDGQGMHLCRRIRAEAPDVLLVIITSYPDPLERLEAMGLGVDDYLLKQADPAELVERLRRTGKR